MIKLYKSVYLLMCLCLSFTVMAQDISIESTPLEISECSDGFVAHTLPHTTAVNQLPVRLYESNGSGLAINDLNNDGLLDIVLANLDAPETILWNEGDLQFRSQILDIPGRTRAVVILDIDVDGWRDIVFTSQRGAPSIWQSQQDETFELLAFPTLSEPAYSMNWADLDNDGDLDLVTGSYDAELERISTNDALFSGGAGVYYYENQDGAFTKTRLADRAQALAILLTDITGDGQPEIAVGNDFAELDRYWTREDDTWQEITPFSIMTHSTMSFDISDFDNDGKTEIFATDMHPYSDDEETTAAWQPVMEDMMAVPMLEGDPQVMLNTLQSAQSGDYENVSAALGIDFSGWSWSSKFGDLDSDGYEDLYIVNGMIAEELFSHLPDNELIEENQVFQNQAGEGFVTVPGWNLNSTASGRGMSMADLDNDGDLDIVVNNLLSPAQLYENQVCGGANLTVTIQQPETLNPDAIGTSLILHTSIGTYRRELWAASGYLSGDAAQIHFGLPDDSEIDYLELIFPDGERFEITEVTQNTHFQITRP
ncbi:MAG: CRTAC1 family protein [Aggregatilineales bacterium]